METAAPLILPVGTQVVTRVAVPAAGETLRWQGAVGVVVAAPADGRDAYRVRFPDGGEASLRRQELAVRTLERAEGLQWAEGALAEWHLERHVIYRCVVGSTAYGLAGADSDVDRRGIYLPPAELQWSLFGYPEQLEERGREECSWELQKFLILALKANPTVLECLYTPIVELATPLAEELRAMRAGFLSRLVYQTYNGYVMSQFKKLETDLRLRGAPRWKHAMHLIRLLLAGIAVLRKGALPLSVGEERERLLATRRGELPWPEVEAWRLELHCRFDAAYAATRLPERPDYAAANAFLVRARRSMVGGIDDGA